MDHRIAGRPPRTQRRRFTPQWSLRQKVGGLVAVLLVLLVVAAITPMIKQQGVRWELDKGAGIYLPLRRSLFVMQSVQNEQALAMERLFRHAAWDSPGGAVAEASATEAFFESTRALDQALSVAIGLAVRDAALGRAATEEESLEAEYEVELLTTRLARIGEDIARVDRLGLEILDHLASDQLNRAAAAGEELRHRSDALQSRLDEALLLVDGFIRDSMEDAERREREATTTSTIVFALALAFGVACAALIVRQLTRSIAVVDRVVGDVAAHLDAGEVPTERILVTSTDEVGRLAETFNRMLDSLRWNVSRREAAEAVLAQQAEQLRRSNEELRGLVSIASHDLRTPLRAVVSFLQLLMRRHGEKLGPEGERYARFAVQGGMEMQALVEDLSAYLEISVAPRQRRPTDVGAALAAALERLRPQLEEAGATVEAGPLPTITAVPAHLTLVLQHLIENAVKFRGDEPPRIEVTAAQDGGDWIIAVSDNGVGIDPAYRDRIFSVFFRLHGAESHTGTGIGLAICRKIVELHGGRIWADSTPGDGSAFRFTIPAEDRAAAVSLA